MTHAAPARSVILVAVQNDAPARSVEEQLRQRYSFDYEIKRLGDDRLEVSDSANIALVLADVLWDESKDLFAAIRDTHPSARRVGIAPWGMPVASAELQALLQTGLAEWFVTMPQVLPDEQFHRAVSEFLEEWSRENGAVFEIVRIVDAGSAKAHRLRDLLHRNNVPHGVYAPSSATGRRLMDEYTLTDDRLPAFILFDGRALADPTDRELADAITGQTGEAPSDVDIVIVGAGPAGLAAALYAASEGLTVAVLEKEAIGGQAGTTSLIRNYLGFQRGITGQELASRAFRQAWGFGANVLFIRQATALSPITDGFLVLVSDGTTIRGRCVVLAQGISYRRLGIPRLEALVGAGVYYGAAVTEAPAIRGKHVIVVGGGNSAGQAASHLAKFASRVTVLVRGTFLAESMSQYLITEMARTPNIVIEFGCETVDGGGDKHLEWVCIEDQETKTRRRVDTEALFVLIGAEPATTWLPREISRDQWGFVRTGRDVEDAGIWTFDRTAYPFETSLPGVFAVGDLRHGSVKRVASAVGEGSVAIQYVHQFMAESEVLTTRNDTAHEE